MSKVNLGDVCTIQSGGTPARSKQEYWNGSIPWVKISDLNSKYLYSTDEFISEEGLKNSSAKIFPENSILFTIFATLGEVAILKNPAATNQAIAGITINDDSELDLDYLYYFLLSLKTYVNGIGRGVAQNNINMSILKSIEIPVLSIGNQRKIAYNLDIVNHLIDLCKNTLEKLDTLVKSRFVEMFGDLRYSQLFPYKKVQDFTKVLSGGTPSRDCSEYWENGQIPWVKTNELKHSFIDKTEEYITDKCLDYSSAKIVPRHSVLIAMYGQGKTRGMTGILNIPASTNQACACVLPSKEMNSIYLWKFFELSYDNLRDLAKGGNQPNLNSNLIKNYPVLFPPINLQNQFSDFVAQVDKQKGTVKKSLEKLETLKKSLMQEYFGRK